MGKRHQMGEVLETVWSEPGSPTSLSSGNSMTASYEMSNGDETDERLSHTRRSRPGRPVGRKARRGQSVGGQLSAFPLDLAEALESLSAMGNGDPDQLFLLPERVLAMDSLSFREDVASVAPCFITQQYNTRMTQSMHYSSGSCEQKESKKSLRVLDDTDGLILTRASNGCLWLCDTTMVSPSQNNVSNDAVNGSSPKEAVGDSSFTGIFDSPYLDTPTKSSKRHFPNRNRNDAVAIQKEREERVRRIREQQEDERKRKLEELKQHAIAAQKFREQQEAERRRHIEELRFKDEDKRLQVEERRKAIEAAERERREALLKKNQEREERLETKRRQQQNQLSYAFGSSTPRILGPKIDSSADVWGGARRSTSSSNVNNQLMTQSMYTRRSSERDQPDSNRTAKRATSAHGLNQTNDGDDQLMTQSFHAGVSSSAHRRRTDLMPTITASTGSPSVSHSGTRASSRAANDGSRSSTPGHKMLRSTGAGLNAPHPRSPSAMSTDAGTPTSGVRMRGSAHPRKPRPFSIATTGIMSSSMHERGSKATPIGSLTPGARPSNLKLTPDVAKPRKTPAQVKAEAAARKAKKSPVTETPPKTPTKSSPAKKPAPPTASTTDAQVPETKPEIALEDVDVNGEVKSEPEVEENKQEVTHDDEPEVDPVAEVEKEAESVQAEVETGEKLEKNPSREASPEEDRKDETESESSSVQKKIITSEEEAKARLAEKRREMKEKKEREAELERQRLLALQREEEERIRIKEEEERRAQEEAERLASEARKLEEERLQKAIEEKERREREQKEKEEQIRRDKEEAERRAKEEAERKQRELDEKLRREEDERLARKRRIEEIMARTRKAKTQEATTPQSPSKSSTDETKSEETNDVTESPKKPVDSSQNDHQFDKVTSDQSAKNGGMTAEAEPEAEKGFLDSQTPEASDDAKMNQKNSDMSEYEPKNLKFEPEVEQIIDLSDTAANGHSQDAPASPFIAFEENKISSPKQELSTGDLLS